MEAGNWQKYEAVLTPDSTCQKASLMILALDNGDMDVDVVSLMPEDTYKGHGLRKDLAQALADLHPKFMRFPGGCVVHGGGDGFWTPSAEEHLGLSSELCTWLFRVFSVL